MQECSLFGQAGWKELNSVMFYPHYTRTNTHTSHTSVSLSPPQLLHLSHWFQFWEWSLHPVARMAISQSVSHEVVKFQWITEHLLPKRTHRSPEFNFVSLALSQAHLWMNYVVQNMKLFLSNCSELGHIKHVTKNGTKIIFPVKLGYCLKKKKRMNEWIVG